MVFSHSVRLATYGTPKRGTEASRRIWQMSRRCDIFGRKLHLPLWLDVGRPERSVFAVKLRKAKLFIEQSCHACECPHGGGGIFSFLVCRSFRMGSLQERIAALTAASANLLTQLNELDELRERVRKAQLLAHCGRKPLDRRPARVSRRGRGVSIGVASWSTQPASSQSRHPSNAG